MALHLTVLGLTLGLAALGCQRPAACVPAPEDTSGEPRQKYDEFTQTTWLTSWFVFTPDTVWGMEDPDFQDRQWSVELWFRGSSKTPLVDVTLRPLCSTINPEDEMQRCSNCDNLCSRNNGYMEILVDGRPLNMPRAKYKRDQIGSPTPDSPATWGSTLSIQVDPRALWPLATAREVKFRVCNAISVTMPPSDLSNLQAYLRHHQSIAPPPGPPGVQRN
jgi:hypothetical protein